MSVEGHKIGQNPIGLQGKTRMHACPSLTTRIYVFQRMDTSTTGTLSESTRPTPELAGFKERSLRLNRQTW